jgi:hypothetical protein
LRADWTKLQSATSVAATATVTANPKITRSSFRSAGRQLTP